MIPTSTIDVTTKTPKLANVVESPPGGRREGISGGRPWSFHCSHPRTDPVVEAGEEVVGRE